MKIIQDFHRKANGKSFSNRHFITFAFEAGKYNGTLQNKTYAWNSLREKQTKVN